MYYSIQKATSRHVQHKKKNNKIKPHVSSLLHNKIPHVKMQIYFKPWKC